MCADTIYVRQIVQRCAEITGSFVLRSGNLCTSLHYLSDKSSMFTNFRYRSRKLNKIFFHLFFFHLSCTSKFKIDQNRKIIIQTNQTTHGRDHVLERTYQRKTSHNRSPHVHDAIINSSFVRKTDFRQRYRR